MLLSQTNYLSIYHLRGFNTLVFSWRGFTRSEDFREGTMKSLEFLKQLPGTKRIILDVRHHSFVMHEDVADSVNATIYHLAKSTARYRMAVIEPLDMLARNSINWYTDSIRAKLQGRFGVRKFATVKSALQWLLRPLRVQLFS